MLSPGHEHVQVALELCRNISDGVKELTAMEEGQKAEVTRRLEHIQEILSEVTDRFFLRTKLCLPFAARCEEGARRLAEALQGLEAHPDSGAQQHLFAALDALEQAAATLEARSAVKGMTIT